MSGILPTGTTWISNILLNLFKTEEKPSRRIDIIKYQKPDETQKSSEESYEEYEYYEESAENDFAEGKHKISKGETLYSIANKYGISVSDLIKANPDLGIDKNGNKIIKIGQFLNVPEDIVIREDNKNPANGEKVYGEWTIEKSKGAFSVMTKFNLYKEELQKLNPDIDLENIKIDQKFKVPGYVIKDGDTFAKIAKEHDITEKMLKELNPEMKSLKAGNIINVPKKADEDLGLGDLEIELEEFIAEETKTYTVKDGDSLSEIAQKNKIPMWALMISNDIKDAQKIYKDQVLVIPNEDDIKELEKTQQNLHKKAQETSNTNQATIKVKKDESLSVIANKLKVPTWALIAKNNIKDPDKLSIGQTLEIPSKEEIAQLQKQNIENKSTPKIKSKTTRKVKQSKTQDKGDYGTISPNLGVITHRVKPKESITSIAKDYNIDVKDIVTYNNLKDVSLTIPLSKQKISNLKIVGNQTAVKSVTGVSQEFINDLISLEKKKRNIYDDDCGYPTIGIGHNTAANKDTKKYRNKTLSDTEIYSLLARDVTNAKNIVKKHLKDDFDNLSSRQKEALYSLIFNTGGLNSSPKLLKALKKGDYAEAAKQFDQVYGEINGRKEVLPGLAKRRFVEIATFLDGSDLNKRELKEVMQKVQEIYNKGYQSIKNSNNRVDFNAFAKKYLGEYIDKGYIKIKS